MKRVISFFCRFPWVFIITFIVGIAVCWRYEIEIGINTNFVLIAIYFLFLTSFFNFSLYWNVREKYKDRGKFSLISFIDVSVSLAALYILIDWWFFRDLQLGGGISYNKAMRCGATILIIHAYCVHIWNVNSGTIETNKRDTTFVKIEKDIDA